MPESKEEFIELLKAHKGILYKIINAYCYDPEDRKDLEQEIVIQVWKSLDSYDSRFKLSTWIYKIALNVAISHLRKDSRRKDSFEPMSESIFKVSIESTSEELLSERTEMLYRFINDLDKLNKALIILYLEEKSYKEIGEIMGISESNVGTKLGRIKNLLKVKFSINNA